MWYNEITWGVPHDQFWCTSELPQVAHIRLQPGVHQGYRMMYTKITWRVPHDVHRNCPQVARTNCSLMYIKITTWCTPKLPGVYHMTNFDVHRNCLQVARTKLQPDVHRDYYLMYTKITWCVPHDVHRNCLQVARTNCSLMYIKITTWCTPKLPGVYHMMYIGIALK